MNLIDAYIYLLTLLLKSMEFRGNLNKETTHILIITSHAFLPKIKHDLAQFDLPINYYTMNLNTLFEAGCSRLYIFEYDNIQQ